MVGHAAGGEAAGMFGKRWSKAGLLLRVCSGYGLQGPDDVSAWGARGEAELAQLPGGAEGEWQYGSGEGAGSGKTVEEVVDSNHGAEAGNAGPVAAVQGVGWRDQRHCEGGKPGPLSAEFVEEQPGGGCLPDAGKHCAAGGVHSGGSGGDGCL